MTVIRCMVPKIWSAMDKIFLSFWIIFWPFLPTNNLKNQNFEKMKKPPGDIIILCKCNINDNHMMQYGFWDTKRGGQNFLSLSTIFCPFIPPNNLKNQNFEKMNKTPRDIMILNMCTINDNHVMHGDSWDIKRNGQFFLSFWPIFCIFTPLTTRKIKIFKKWKNNLEILSLYTCVPLPEIWSVYQKSWSLYAILFLRYGAW